MTTRPWILLVFLLHLLAPTAWADDAAMKLPTEPRALAHYTQGNRLYRLRKFDDAVAEYQAGAMIDPAPVFDYNLGQCYRQLGKHTEAIWHYERFLKNGQPSSERQSLVTGFLSQMRAEMERKAMSRSSANSAADPNRAAAPSGPSPTLPASPAAPVADHGGRWYSDHIGWGLVGAGVAGAGISGVLFLSSSSLRDDANLSPIESRREELRDTARTRERISLAIGAGGVALMVGGLIKLAIHPGEHPRARVASWRLGASPRGLVVLGRF